MRPFLYCSLISLGGTICLVLASFQISIAALEAVRLYWQEHHEGNYQFTFPSGLGNRVKFCNFAGGALFGIGVISAVLFIVVNVSHQSSPKEVHMSTNRLQEGAVIKTPMNPDVQRGANVKASFQSAPKPNAAQPSTPAAPKK